MPGFHELEYARATLDVFIRAEKKRDKLENRTKSARERSNSRK